jgi:hypothetical protein
LTSLRVVFAVAVSIIIGAMTHNAWDSFTHPAGYMVAKLPVLRKSVWMLGNTNVRVYELLQHASTLLGLLIVVVAYVKWLKRVGVVPVTSGFATDRWRYGLLFALLVGSVILAIPVTYETLGRANRAVVFVRLVIWATTIFVVGLCSASLLLSGRGKRML